MPVPFILSRLEPNGYETFIAGYNVDEGADIDAALQELCISGTVPGPMGSVPDPANHRLQRSEIDFCHFYPRCARPVLTSGFIMGERPPGPLYLRTENGAVYPPSDSTAVAAAMNQLSILVSELRLVFQNIEPNRDNMNCYGHQISNVLILAAMNFENESKSVLRANGYTITNRANTTDYVKILPALKLNDFQISFPYYPQIDPIKPFELWDSDAPTRSLYWYDGYNSVKHDRYQSLAFGNLRNATAAIAACAIMLAAQYRSIAAWTDQIGDFFHFEQKGEWTMAESYLAPAPSDTWIRRNYPF